MSVGTQILIGMSTGPGWDGNPHGHDLLGHGPDQARVRLLHGLDSGMGKAAHSLGESCQAQAHLHQQLKELLGHVICGLTRISNGSDSCWGVTTILFAKNPKTAPQRLFWPFGGLFAIFLQITPNV